MKLKKIKTPKPRKSAASERQAKDMRFLNFHTEMKYTSGLFVEGGFADADVLVGPKPQSYLVQRSLGGHYVLREHHATRPRSERRHDGPSVVRPSDGLLASFAAHVAVHKELSQSEPTIFKTSPGRQR